MSSVAPVKEEVVTNYYDGRKFFLVSVDGKEFYISEDKLEKNGHAHRISVKNSF